MGTASRSRYAGAGGSMRQIRFGNTGDDLPVIGLGTWNMEGDDRQEAIRALRRGIALGATHVDTAELYGRGEVERMVGEALGGGLRDQVVLVSKVLPDNASRKGTVEACERSLQRLKTDRLDGYLLHWPGRHPLTETVLAFEELVSSGKIRWWGVSNFDEEELGDVVRIAGPGRVACDQVLYHLDERAIEHRAIPACREQDVAIVAYSPLGSGRFPSPGSSGGRVLGEIATRLGATPRQVALAFLVHGPGQFAIPKASKVAHVEELVPAGDLVLEEPDVAAIDAAFPLGPWRPGVPTL